MEPSKKSELVEKRKADYWKLWPFVLQPNLYQKFADVTDDSRIESRNSVDTLDRMKKERP